MTTGRLRLVAAAVVAALGLVLVVTGDRAAEPVDRATLSAQQPPDRSLARAAASPLARLETRMGRLRGPLRSLTATANRLRRWYGCLRAMPVSQAGDPHHEWGFVYDELDGTGIDFRTALVPHTGAGRPDVLMIRVLRRPGCLSAAPDPNGTGSDASVGAAGSRSRPGEPSLARLRTQLNRIEARIDLLDDEFDRFDEWESCLSWLPVSEYGDELQNLGFHVSEDPPPPGDPLRLPALDLDDRAWDDPDYMFLAFVGRDRPFTSRECENEPGEGVDRVGWYVDLRQRGPARRPSPRARLRELRRDLADAAERIEDLGEPAEEFVHFDECMFTVGMQVRGGDELGYEFRTRSGTLRRLSALSYDLSDGALPQLDVMAFPRRGGAADRVQRGRLRGRHRRVRAGVGRIGRQVGWTVSGAGRGSARLAAAAMTARVPASSHAEV